MSVTNAVSPANPVIEMSIEQIKEVIEQYCPEREYTSVSAMNEFAEQLWVSELQKIYTGDDLAIFDFQEPLTALPSLEPPENPDNKYLWEQLIFHFDIYSKLSNRSAAPSWSEEEIQKLCLIRQLVDFPKLVIFKNLYQLDYDHEILCALASVKHSRFIPKFLILDTSDAPSFYCNAHYTIEIDEHGNMQVNAT